MNTTLFTETQRRRFFVEFDLGGLLRGDPEQRFASYRIGREIGVFSANEIRRLEGLPPVEGGDTYMQPMNMNPLGGDGGGDGAA
jgi:phage portal protein BeeE